MEEFLAVTPKHNLKSPSPGIPPSLLHKISFSPPAPHLGILTWGKFSPFSWEWDLQLPLEQGGDTCRLLTQNFRRRWALRRSFVLFVTLGWGAHNWARLLLVPLFFFFLKKTHQSPELLRGECWGLQQDRAALCSPEGAEIPVQVHRAVTGPVPQVGPSLPGTPSSKHSPNPPALTHQEHLSALCLWLEQINWAKIWISD